MDTKTGAKPPAAPPDARPGDPRAEGPSALSDPAAGAGPGGKSLVGLAEELEHTMHGLTEYVATAVPSAGRDELERHLEDLRRICASVRGVALLLDSLLAEGIAEQRDAFRAIVGGLGETMRETADARRATLERMKGEMRELDAIGTLDPPEAVATRLQDVLVSVREVAGEVDRHARVVAAEADSAERQLTGLERQLNEANERTLRDKLTGIGSRRALELALGYAASGGSAAAPWCFLLIDIDRFRATNEAHGRFVGDALLCTLALLIAEALPAAREKHAVGRYGGEEFGILMRRTTLQHAAALAEEIRERIASSKWTVRGDTDIVLHATVSIGITQYQPGDTAAAVVGRATAALRRAKAEGRNRVALEHGGPEIALAARRAALRGRL